MVVIRSRGSSRWKLWLSNMDFHDEEMLNWKFEKFKKHPRDENQFRKIIGDMFNQYNITGDTSLTSLGAFGS